jgi:hypothetical protein
MTGARCSPRKPATDDKDRDFVRVLLVERLVTAAVLIERLRALGLPVDERERRVEWVQLTAKGLRPPRRR